MYCWYCVEGTACEARREWPATFGLARGVAIWGAWRGE